MSELLTGQVGEQAIVQDQTSTSGISLAPSTPEAPTGAWFESIKDDGMRGYVEAKGYKGIEDIIAQQQNYEKLISAEKANSTLIMPGADATPEQMAEFYNKLGRPATAKEYEIAAPEGSDPAFSENVANWMHELGLNKTQAQALSAKYGEYAASTMAQMQQQKEVEVQNQTAALKQEWAQNFDRNVELARRASRMAGIDEATAMKMQDAIGTKAMMKIFHTFGEGFSEHKIEGVGNSASPFGMSLEGSKARRQEIMNDPGLRNKYLSGDAQLRAEVDRLNKAIAGA